MGGERGRGEEKKHSNKYKFFLEKELNNRNEIGKS